MTLRSPMAQLAGWAVVAVANTLAITVLVAWPDGGVGVRAAHHAYDVGHCLALGFATMGLAAAWERWGVRRWWWAGDVAVFAVALGAAAVVLHEDLASATRKLGDREGNDALLVGLLAVGAGGVVAAGRVGRVLARPRWRWLGVGAAAGAAVANHAVYPNAYAGLHLWLAGLAAVFAGGALMGVPVPSRLGRPSRWWRPRWVAAAVGVGALATVVTWPGNAVVIELYRSPGTALAPFLARVHFQDVAARPVVGRSADWYVERDQLPPIAASKPLLVGPDAIVVVITIDAVRADILDHEKWASVMPTIQALRVDGIEFSQARSTGSQTVYTLATMFSGKHFSQQRWTAKNKKKLTAELWPWEDPTPRFPQLLQGRGIRTATYASAWWLVSSMGVVRGFDIEEKIRSEVKTDYNFPLAADVMAPALSLVENHGDGPLFLYMHFMEPHSPYTRGGKKGGRIENYAKEVGMVDVEIRKLIDVLERTGKWSRTVLIVSSDHGEAFGEHGTKKHATTLYEELLRVPLIVRVPGAKPRIVDEPVSTVDIGPTVLDLYGIDTPAHFMGQSLVPFLRGDTVQLTRPIVAEGRLKQALVTRDGFKAIRDIRRGTLELYDLTTDPGELHNLATDTPNHPTLNRLRKFFQVHTYRTNGYRVPYRK